MPSVARGSLLLRKAHQTTVRDTDPVTPSAFADMASWIIPVLDLIGFSAGVPILLKLVGEDGLVSGNTSAGYYLVRRLGARCVERATDQGKSVPAVASGPLPAGKNEG